MNIAVWIVQILVGLLFVAQGVYMHGFGADQVKTRQGMHGLAPSLGHGWPLSPSASSSAGSVWFLPAATGILPWLTPLAAALLALIMLLAAGFHLRRREYPNIILNLILLALAAFVAYGRFVLAPL